MRKPVALVTGAGRGIGRGISLALAGNGFDVAGVDIVYEPGNKTTGLFEVREKARELGAGFFPIKGDIAAIPGQQKLLDRLLEKFGRLDVLVNNAGVAPEKRMDILETTTESYDRVMSINARAAFFLTQKAAGIMIGLQKEAGREAEPITPCIIFITSISASVSSPNRAEYCISKAALSQAARLFADRLASFGIGVYEIRPGIIRTDMTAPVKEKYDKLIAEGLVPQGRWGLPEDVGRAAVGLARGYFPYSTGAVIEVSGGMDIRRL